MVQGQVFSQGEISENHWTEKSEKTENHWPLVYMLPLHNIIYSISCLVKQKMYELRYRVQVLLLKKLLKKQGFIEIRNWVLFNIILWCNYTNKQILHIRRFTKFHNMYWRLNL